MTDQPISPSARGSSPEQGPAGKPAAPPRFASPRGAGLHLLLDLAAAVLLGLLLPALLQRLEMPELARLLPVLRFGFPLAMAAPALAAAGLLRLGVPLPMRGLQAAELLGTPFLAAIVAALTFPEQCRDLQTWIGACLLGLWFCRSAALVAALLLSARRARLPLLAIALTAAAVYVPLTPWTVSSITTDGDEPHLLLITHSLLHDGDLDLSNNYIQRDYEPFFTADLWPQPWEKVTEDGGRYSNHPPTLPALMLPAYAVGGRLAATYTLTLIAVGLAVVLYQLALRVGGSQGAALFAWALGAFSFPLLINASQITPEVLAGTLVPLAILLIRDLDPRRRRRLIALAGIIVLLPAIKPRYLLFAGPLFLLAAWRLVRLSGAEQRRRLAWAFGGGTVLLVAALLGFNFLVYGNPLVTHRIDWILFNDYLQPSALLDGLVGSLLDQEFGLLIYAPVYLFALFGLVACRGREKQDRRLILAAIVPYMFVVAMRPLNNGGPPPDRFFSTVLPELAVFFAVYHRRSEKRPLSPLLVAAALWSLVIGGALLLEPAWRYNRGYGRAFILVDLSSRLDVALTRVFPSFFRETSGTLPLVAALLLALVVFHLRERRRPERATTPAPRSGGALMHLVTPVSAGVALFFGICLFLPVAARHAPTLNLQPGDLEVKEWKGGSLSAQFDYPGGPGLLSFWITRADSPRPALLDVEADGALLGRIPVGLGKERLYQLPFRLAPGRHILRASRPAAGVSIIRLEIHRRGTLRRGSARALAAASRLLPGVLGSGLGPHALRPAARRDPVAVELAALQGSWFDHAEPEFAAELLRAGAHWHPTAGQANLAARAALYLAANGETPRAARLAGAIPIGAVEQLPDLFTSAELLRLRGVIPRALRRYKRILREEPENRQALLGAIRCAEQLNDEQLLLELLQQGFANDILQRKGLVRLASLLRDRDDEEAAREVEQRLQNLPPLVIEGEQMFTLEPHYVFGGLGIHTNGVIGADLFLTPGRKRVTMRALGSTAIGLWPLVHLTIGSQLVWNGAIDSREYREYSAVAELPGGEQRLAIEFYNDYDDYLTYHGLNVVVDWVRIEDLPPDPAPRSSTE